MLNMHGVLEKKAAPYLIEWFGHFCMLEKVEIYKILLIGVCWLFERS